MFFSSIEPYLVKSTEVIVEIISIHLPLMSTVAFFVLVFPGALVHRWAFLWLVPSAILFGAAIEYLQPYFGRSREVADLYADIAGILGGVIAGTLVRLWRTSE